MAKVVSLVRLTTSSALRANIPGPIFQSMFLFYWIYSACRINGFSKLKAQEKFDLLDAATTMKSYVWISILNLISLFSDASNT